MQDQLKKAKLYTALGDVTKSKHPLNVKMWEIQSKFILTDGSILYSEKSAGFNRHKLKNYPLSILSICVGRGIHHEFIDGRIQIVPERWVLTKLSNKNVAKVEAVNSEPALKPKKYIEPKRAKDLNPKAKKKERSFADWFEHWMHKATKLKPQHRKKPSNNE